jgi:hypothetical protein
MTNEMKLCVNLSGVKNMSMNISNNSSRRNNNINTLDVGANSGGVDAQSSTHIKTPPKNGAKRLTDHPTLLDPSIFGLPENTSARGYSKSPTRSLGDSHEPAAKAKTPKHQNAKTNATDDARIKKLTHHSQADRDADPNYKLVLESNQKIATNAAAKARPEPAKTPTPAAEETSVFTKGLTSAIGLVTDGLGVVAGAAMTATGAALVVTPEPTTLSKWAGVPLTAYGATFTAKSAVGVGLNATNLWSAMQGKKSESDYMPGSALEWAVRANGGSPEAERAAIAVDMAWGLASGRVLDARLATGALTNPRAAALLQAPLTTTVSREAARVAPKTWEITEKITPFATVVDTGYNAKADTYDPLKKAMSTQPP